ncbi:MAG: hypothetical protein GY805_39965 [Chloroflexi bacterium]|nr:hypothetical protein [Chloroflexota bacterium]
MSGSNTAVPREFRCLITQLQSPTAEAEASSLSRYPWSDEAMIARYGMRYATPEERRIFPRKRLVISVFKVKIAAIGKSPYMDPGIGIGSVVWAVEWYPGIHQFRMLDRDLLQEEYNQIVWERVPEDTLVTTEASARREQVQRQWRRKVCSSIQQNLRL